jgi:hypothetical protein
MSDSEYESDYGEQAPEPVDVGVQKRDKPKKKPMSDRKLEQLRKARDAKRKKREERMKQPPKPPPEPEPEPEPAPEPEVETVYVKKPKKKTQPKKAKAKPKKKKIVYVESESSSMSSESEEEEEVRYVKRRPRRSKPRQVQYVEPKSQQQLPPEYGSMYQRDHNGDVVW